MDPETRDKIREAARRQSNCPRCGGSTRLLTDLEKQRNDGCFPDVDYTVCMSCGDVRAKKTRKKR